MLKLTRNWSQKQAQCRGKSARLATLISSSYAQYVTCVCCWRSATAAVWPLPTTPSPQAPSNQCQTSTDSSLLPTTRLPPRFHLPSRLVYDIATQFLAMI